MTARVALVALWVFFASAPAFAERPKVGIFEFEVSENVAPGVGGFLYFALVERMVASGKYTVVDWEEIDRKRQYIAKSQPTISEEDAKRQAMHELGIEQMYVGAVQKVGERYRIGVKVLNLDLTVAAAEGEWARDEAALEGAIDRLVARLLMSPEERAAMKREAVPREPAPSGKGRLSVQATPVDARVRILNIKPRYRPGIALEPGSYHIEVSKPGFRTKRQWIRVGAGEDKRLAIALQEGRRVSGAEKRRIEGEYLRALAKGDVPLGLALRYLLVQQPLWREESAFQGALAAWERGDLETATKEFRRLAEMGIPQAQYALARMYADGQGVSESDAQAVTWYRRAAEHGIAQAQTNLGGMYEVGRGVRQDDAEAVRWYRRAAEQGFAAGQNDLGFMYSEGRGVRQDDAEAVRWFRKAAEQGYAMGQSNLGWMYEHGRGVRQDDAEAVRWYRRAAEQGFADARAALDRLCKRSPSPVREACD